MILFSALSTAEGQRPNPQTKTTETNIDSCSPTLRESNDAGDRPYTPANYGVALRRAKRLEESRAVLNEAVQLFPTSAEVHNQLAVVLIETRHFDKAIIALKRAVELAPNLEEPHYNLALAQLATRNKTAALEQYALLKRIDSTLAPPLFRIIYGNQLLFVERK